MNIETFKEIINGDSTNQASFLAALKMLQENVLVILKTNEKDELYYVAKVDDILESNITKSQLEYIRDNGWKLTENSDFIIKFLD